MRSSMPAARGDLSSRELDLLRTAVQWADHARDRRHCLRVTEHVWKSHMKSIYRKLDVASRADAVRTGAAGGLL
jgi:ATP/maltotriose-dependent transcriptional regulator MalT